MSEKYIDLRTLKFQLFDVHQVDGLLKEEYFSMHDVSSIHLFLDSIRDFAEQECYPYFREMDEKPAYFDGTTIKVHPQVGKVMRMCGEMGLIAAPIEMEHGGLQLPLAVHTTAMAIMEAANNNLPGYPGLTLGAAELVTSFGSKELIETYTPKMFSGEWGGTMCLTEPQAGSSLSDITTTATRAEDGSFRLKGQKIFISGGDHEFSENFVHLMIARIEDAPAGTRGISLFVVPKLRPDGAGGLTPNDVKTAGDFQKMGQRGYCTSHLIFGEEDDCHGWLVGAEHRGLKYMFKMMNAARIAVGRGGAAVAMAAYHASLQYAKERPQGRLVQDSGSKNVDSEQTLIINHPDVRRMLLLQRAFAEGSFSLVLQGAYYADKMTAATDPAEKEKYNILLEILTPMVKTYPTEKGQESISNGLQILGGYGFCSEFVLQQYYRDIRIFTLYEGTTGIQSIDLLGRKMTINNGAGPALLAQEIMVTIQAALQSDQLAAFGKILGSNLQSIGAVTKHLLEYAQAGKHNRFLSDATIFMDFMSTIVVGWQWLKMALEAENAIKSGNMTYPEAFYKSKIQTMRFFFKYEMGRMQSLASILKSDESLTLVEDGVDAFA